MRRIDDKAGTKRRGPASFQVATRGTSREVNRGIVLNLVRTNQPISRADVARLMSDTAPRHRRGRRSRE